MDLESIARDLSERFCHPRWILLTDVAANATKSIETLREWGGGEFLVIGSTMGVGDEPDAEVVLTGGGPVPIMESFRRFVRMLEDPPAVVRDAVATFDPDDSARALGPLFAAPEVFMGRRLYGTRPRAWEGLEDKTVAEAIWAEAGIPHARAEVVAVADAPDAGRRVGGPLGSVWAADNTEGWHGGGAYTRWIAGDGAAADAVDWFGTRAETVRVMPFLDGIPCSIHGFVTADGVAAGRPVELLILRRSDRTGFVYGGVATVWDPDDALRAEMRSAARAVGEVLRRRADYRGPFGIDGVATSDGFRPTELNPRFSVGFGAQAGTIEGLEQTFFVRAVVERDLDVAAEEVERLVVSSADAERRCHVGFAFEVEHDPDTLEMDPADGGGTLALGSSPTGSFVRWTPDMDDVTVGEPFGPKVARAAEVIRQHWGLPVPDVEASGDVRRHIAG